MLQECMSFCDQCWAVGFQCIIHLLQLLRIKVNIHSMTKMEHVFKVKQRLKIPPNTQPELPFKLLLFVNRFWSFARIKPLISLIKMWKIDSFFNPSYNSTTKTGILNVCQQSFENVYMSLGLVIGCFMRNFSTVSVQKTELMMTSIDGVFSAHIIKVVK